MSEITFEDVYQFIVDAFPQYKNDKLSVSKIKELLKKLLNDRMDELTVLGIDHDDWPDDDDIQEIEEYINIIDKSN
jgi:hypothetical protein